MSAASVTSQFHLNVTAEVGRAHAPFLRTNVKRAHGLLVAWASRPSRNRGATARKELKTAPREHTGETPMPRLVVTRSLQGLSLVLVGDRRMSDLHAQFMGIAGPTDVLTFPLDQDARGRVTSGEVYVCVPEATRQARARKIPLRLELLLYGLHGMLHLLGCDDRTARDFALMHRTEDAILTGLGFGPVFAAPATAAAAPRRRRTGSASAGAGTIRPRGRGGSR